jgi:hypothetical protein
MLLCSNDWQTTELFSLVIRLTDLKHAGICLKCMDYIRGQPDIDPGFSCANSFSLSRLTHSLERLM